MDKFLALLLAAIGFVYADLDSTNILEWLVLPVIFAVSFLYLFGVIRTAAAMASAICFYFTDILSTSLFEAFFLPFLGVSFALYFMFFGMTGKNDESFANGWIGGHVGAGFGCGNGASGDGSDAGSCGDGGGGDGGC